MGIVLAILALVRLWHGDRPAETPGVLVEGTYRIQRVVDGDTIRVEPGTIVRLIGVNTPETVKPEHPVEPWGPEATTFTREFLSGGSARLEFDRERLDQFGRVLAYVYVDDAMLNEELLLSGLARFEPHFRYSSEIKSRFRQAQQEAQRAHRGIWSQGAPARPAPARTAPARPVATPSG